MINEAEKTIVCDSCDAYRRVDAEGYVEPCPNCDDGEYNLYEEFPHAEVELSE